MATVTRRALERALDLAEPDGMLLAFPLFPALGLLERHARGRTAHASLLAEIRGLLAARTPAAPAAGPQPPLEPLSDSEIRVLRCLPTNLSISDIADELYVSPNTVKTHMRHLYGKLGTNRAARPSPAPAPSACSRQLDDADLEVRSRVACKAVRAAFELAVMVVAG
jgi:LuxR family transcriptional regulator, maltose regulon positive regulatory protein